MDYQEFLKSKQHSTGTFGFDANYFPEIAFDFQKFIIEKAIKKGRVAIFADTGLGKTLIQIAIAKNIVNHTNRRVLIVTPLAVAFQFILEAEKLGIDDIEYSKEGKFTKKIVICNYERLHFFNEEDFEAIILDESSILKNFDGAIKTQITSFSKKIKYRFFSTATPAPNDYIEFGTTSEALGYLPYMEMLQRYFRNNENNIRPQDIGSKWYLKPHAKNDFFAWVNEWSINIKKPSDLGFSDDNYFLPELIENKVIVKNNCDYLAGEQMSFLAPLAKTMSEVRIDQKKTIELRCMKALELAQGKTSVYWCHFNDEGDFLEENDKEAIQISGSDSLEKKEEILISFAKGEIKRLITKPKITSFGLNWQHCNHSVYFPSWSYEQYYQAVRRFWRFGQKNPVSIDLVLCDSQKRVADALLYKTEKALEYQRLIHKNLRRELTFSTKEFNQQVTLPTFLK